MLFVLLIGNKCPVQEDYWCRDCKVADPLINEEVSICPVPIVLVTIAVCRDFLKPTSVYRMNPLIKLTSVPSLIK